MDFSKYLDFIVENETAHGIDQWDGFKKDFGVKTYYADYVKAGFKYKPKSIMEIGIRFGYSAMALVYGSQRAGIKDINLVGLDDEGYHQGSNQEAADHFLKLFPECNAKFYTINTVTNGFPEEIEDQTFDLIHVDGNHSVAGALKDMMNSWRILNKGGLMIVDDCTFWDVGLAIKEFEPNNLKETYEVMNERGQRYYVKR